MSSGVPGYIADAILGHGDKKKPYRNLYLTLSDDDLVGAIDMMKFDIGETEIRVKKRDHVGSDQNVRESTNQVRCTPDFATPIRH
jgi:hypothetical protein